MFTFLCIAIPKNICYNRNVLIIYGWIFSHGGRRESMKKNIHPQFMETKVTCSCGNTFTVQSNKPELHIEVCDKCHPFFSGNKEGAAASKAGRVEKFNRKYGLKTEK